MAKIRITEKQYNTILLHEQQSRLGDSSCVINESLDQSVDLLEEGWKEVVLGVALLLGVGLSGSNKLAAQNALKNDSTMAQIKATLDSELKTKELADSFKEKGMKDPDSLLSKNANKVIDQFNDIASNNNINYRVSTKAVDNLKSLDASLKQGYAVKNIEKTTDTIQAPVENTIITVKDTIEVELGSDNLFVTGGYTLSEGGSEVITATLDSIRAKGGRVVGVNIESSTDAEVIRKFQSESDSTGNIKLASLRTQSVTDLMNQLDTNVSITHREIPNNGADVVSTKEFSNAASNPEALDSLRKQTSEFRYVKMTLVVEYDQQDTLQQPKPDQVITTYRYDLVKVIEMKGKSKSIRTKARFPHKKFTCKPQKKAKTGKVDRCTTHF